MATEQELIGGHFDHITPVAFIPSHPGELKFIALRNGMLTPGRIGVDPVRADEQRGVLIEALRQAGHEVSDIGTTPPEQIRVIFTFGWVRETLQNIMDRYPLLTRHGFGLGGLASGDVTVDRASLLSEAGCHEFMCALVFLNTHYEPAPFVNLKIGSSYGLKHAAEGWLRSRYSDGYVSNGAFIAAAIYLGYGFGKGAKGQGAPNVYLRAQRRRPKLHVIHGGGNERQP